jgi:hypothetical protein
MHLGVALFMGYFLAGVTGEQTSDFIVMRGKCISVVAFLWANHI